MARPSFKDGFRQLTPSVSHYSLGETLESVPEQLPSTLNLDTVLALIEPLAEWELLERKDRRALLATLCPEISVYRYTVKSLKLNLVPAPALVGTRPASRARFGTRAGRSGA